jgi:hypothetical protein
VSLAPPVAEVAEVVGVAVPVPVAVPVGDALVQDTPAGPPTAAAAGRDSTVP